MIITNVLNESYKVDHYFPFLIKEVVDALGAVIVVVVAVDAVELKIRTLIHIITVYMVKKKMTFAKENYDIQSCNYSV